MRKLLAGLMGANSDAEPLPQSNVAASNSSSNSNNPTTEPARRGSLLRGRSGKLGKSGNGSVDIIPSLILTSAGTLGDAIQNIITDTAKLSGDNLSGYETLLCILNDATDLDDPMEVAKASGMGCVQLLVTSIDHPKFIELCNQRNLAAGLFQAMRLLRMFEIKQAKIVLDNPAFAPNLASTFDASHKICKIFEKLCTNAATIEQIHANIVKILTFPLCVLPAAAKHIQIHSAAIVNAICKTGFTSQQVWHLHDAQCITHLVRHLYELTMSTADTSSGTQSLTNTPTKLSAVDSNFSTSTVGLTSSTDYLLRGLQAEAEGMWLVALECVVHVMSCTVSVGTVLLNDFESASGHKLLINILKNCSPDRFLRALNIVMLLLLDPKKRDEDVQILSSVASMLSDFLVDIIGLRQTIQPSSTVESLIDTCNQVIDIAEYNTANHRMGLNQYEYVVQGMAYSLLTVYSNEPVACVRLEDSYHFLSCLLTALPSLLHSEAMSAILTTLNYVCQCIDSPTKMIINSLTAVATSIVQRFLENSSLFSYNNKAVDHLEVSFLVHQVELVFTSVEAICRTNKAYVVQFMKANLFKYVLTEPFEKLYHELQTHYQQHQDSNNTAINNAFISVFERIISLTIDLNDKNTYAAEDVRRSNVLLLIKKIVLVYDVSTGFINSLLRLYEELAKVDSVHLQEVVMILIDLVKELDKDLKKIPLIYDSLWRMLVRNEGFYKLFLKEHCVEICLQSLCLLENVFDSELRLYSDQDLVFAFKCLTSVLRFASLLLFFTIETQYHYNMYLTTYVTIGHSILSTKIFDHPNYRLSGLVICLQFITVFSYDQDIIYAKSLDIFQPLLPQLPEDILTFLIQKLNNYATSGIIKKKRIGDIKLVPKFLNTLMSSSKTFQNDNLLSSFISECVTGNWQSDALFEVIRTCIKPAILNYDSSANGSSGLLCGLDFENAQSPFEDAPYIGIPLFMSAENDSGSVASLAMFFNEATVPMPSNALSISCWFRVDHDNASPDSISNSLSGRRPSSSLNTMIPILSMESAGSDVHLNIEVNPLTSDVVVICTTRTESGKNNMYGVEQDLLVFKPSFPLSIDGERWTHCVITMKRVKRFTASNQVQIAMYFNGLPWIPHSSLSNTANNQSPTGPSQASNANSPSSQNLGLLNLDPLASSHNGEIRVGLPKDSQYPYESSTMASDKILQTQHIVLQVANVSVYNETLHTKQVSALFMEGPTYSKIHQSSDSPITDSLATLSARALTISNEMYRNALNYIDRLGWQGIEYVAEPRQEGHREISHDFDKPTLPQPVAMIHPLFTLPEHIAFQAFTQRPNVDFHISDSSVPIQNGVSGSEVLSTKARLLRYTLVNIADLENSTPLATLSSGGYISRSMSIGDCGSTLGGPDIFLPLLLYVQKEDMLCSILSLIRQHLLINAASLKYMQQSGYRIMAFLLSHTPQEILTTKVLELLIRFSVSASYTSLRLTSESLLLVDHAAWLHLICNHHVWGLHRYSMIFTVITYLKKLVSDEKYAVINAMKLSCLGIVRWILFVCLQIVKGAIMLYDSKVDMDPAFEVWVYAGKSACEFADYRDEPIPFLSMGMDVIIAILNSELKAVDIDLIISMVLNTFVQTKTASKGSVSSPAEVDELESPAVKFNVWDNFQQDDELTKRQAEAYQSHPFCTYEHIHCLNTNNEDPLTSSSSSMRYLQPLEVYRIYLLRLLFNVYDDNLEEQRRPSRRPSNPRANANPNKDSNSPNDVHKPSSVFSATNEIETCNIFRQIVPAHILLGILEQSTDIATATYTLRLLAYLLQKDPVFHKEFMAMKGYQILYGYVIQQVYIPIPVLLPFTSLLFRIPVHLIMHPYQIKAASKIIHLIDLEESVGPSVQETAVIEQSVPLLFIYYECIGLSIKYYINNSVSKENLSQYMQTCESLVLNMMDHALDTCPSFKYLYQHILALELHVNAILTCTNAYSEYGSIIYGNSSNNDDRPDLSNLIQDNYLDGVHSHEEANDVDSDMEESNIDSAGKQLDLTIYHPLGNRLIKLYEKIMFVLLKDFEYNKLLCHSFMVYNIHTYTASYLRSYQLLIIQCYSNVVSQCVLNNTNSIDYSLLAATNKNITFLLPLLKSNYIYIDNLFRLLCIQMEVFKKYTAAFKSLLVGNKQQANSNVTLDMHQNLIRDMNCNLRCLILFLLHNNNAASPSFSTNERYKILTFVKDHTDYIFYHIIEDQIDNTILKYINSNKANILSNENNTINQFTTTNMQLLETLQNMTTSTNKYSNKTILANSLPILSLAHSQPHYQSLYNIQHTNTTTNSINHYKLERNKLISVFILYLLNYTYNLVLEEDTATRIQATRVISQLASARKVYIEILCSNNTNIVSNLASNTSTNIVLSNSNNSPPIPLGGSGKMWKNSILFTEESESNSYSLSYSSSTYSRPSSQGTTTTSSSSTRNSTTTAPAFSITTNPPVDLYKDGICKLIPNAFGQYDLDLRSRVTPSTSAPSNIEEQYEESRFADFSYFISQHNGMTDKLFVIFSNVINSILPYSSVDSEEMGKISKQLVHIHDLWSILYTDVNLSATLSNTSNLNTAATNANNTLSTSSNINIMNLNAFNNDIYNSVQTYQHNLSTLNTMTNNPNHNNYSLNTAENIQNTYLRLIILNKIGEKILKQNLYWSREGIREIVIGGVAWKKVYHQNMSNPIWGNRVQSIYHNLLKNKSIYIDNNYIPAPSNNNNLNSSAQYNLLYRKVYHHQLHYPSDLVIYTLDYRHGLEHTRRKVKRDFSNYANTFYYTILEKNMTSVRNVEENKTDEEVSNNNSIDSSKKLFLPKNIKMKSTNNNSIDAADEDVDENLAEEEANNNDNYEYEPSPLLEPTMDDYNIESSMKVDNNISSILSSLDNPSNAVKSNEDYELQKPPQSAATLNTSSISMPVSNVVNVGTNSSDSQYKSLMIKEILRGIIGNQNELKKCAFYNIERIYGLESQKGLLIVGMHSIHIISNFKVLGSSPCVHKPFHQTMFDYTPSVKVENKNKQSNSNSNPNSPGLDDKYAQVNNIHNENIPTMLDKSYLSANSTLKELYYTNTGSSFNMKKEWMEELWIEMLEMETFYDKIKIEEIHSFFKRRYQLKNVALEIADVHGLAILFACETVAACDEILTSLVEHDLPHSIYNKMLGLKNIQLLRGANNIYARLLHLFVHNLTLLWQNNSISNFEYLYYINAAAGRSYLDLTQYPVYPWVLSDYQSEELDLNDPGNFRDLSSPMGCIGAKRKQQYMERYEMMLELFNSADEEEQSSIENIPFYYGTHYSCAGYVLYYLIRLQPYTNMYIHLQDGHLDKADRLFWNIKASYQSAAYENLQDVRELIPEFYYLPQFLSNLNNIQFGSTQKGEIINHVVLPPWAKNSAHYFIYKHRQALECKIVSESLNQWIDLIFGYKARGKNAILNINAFMHITYEDELDVESIEEGMLRQAIIAQINNFGICPKQIFTKPHVKKMIPDVVKAMNTGEGSVILVEPVALNWHQHMSPPLCVIGAAQFTILTRVSISQASYVNNQKGEGVGDLKLISRDKIIATPEKTTFLSAKRIIKYRTLPLGLVVQNISFIGSRALETEKELSFHEPLHLRAITAVAVDKQAKTIVTGAEDGSVRVWELFAENQQRKLSLLSSLVAHHTAVSCLDINSKLNILVSGSIGGYVCIWDSQQFCLLYKISGFMGPVVSVSCNAVAGYVLVATADELRLYTVSGELYSYEYFDVHNEEHSSFSSKRQEGVGMGPGNMNSTKPNTSFDVSGACTAMIAVPCGDWQDGVVAVTGHSDGSVFLWKLDSKLIEVPYPDVPAAARKTSQATCMIRRLYIACTPEKCHRNEITCLRLSSTSGTANSTTKSKDAICRAFGDSRHLDLLVGDKDGAVSRWTPFKLDQLSQTDLNSLIAASVSK